MALTTDKCVVCDVNPPKYTCPRCSLTTCSLNCVNIHKKELSCNGIRDKTGYVSLKKFDNLNLLNDYRFLEDIDRSLDSCRRNPQKRYTRYMQPLPTHLYRLKSAAERRGIHLQFLPQHFTRHSENKTILKYDTQIIHWKIDFIFPQGEMLKVSEVIEETTKLSKALDKYINYKSCPQVYNQMLRFYHSSGISDVVLLLKAERVRQQNSFYLLDLHSTVKENLISRVIVENPIIYVIRKAYKDEYHILDDSDVIDKPFEVLHGKKSGFFGDFTPVGHFDELQPKVKKMTKADLAMEEILNTAAELRMRDRFEEKEDSDTEVLPPQRNIFNIPSYETLCSQNSRDMQC